MGKFWTKEDPYNKKLEVPDEYTFKDNEENTNVSEIVAFVNKHYEIYRNVIQMSEKEFNWAKSVPSVYTTLYHKDELIGFALSLLLDVTLLESDVLYTYKNCNVAHTSYLTVHSDYRNKNMAALLIRKIMELTSEKGFRMGYHLVEKPIGNNHSKIKMVVRPFKHRVVTSLGISLGKGSNEAHRLKCTIAENNLSIKKGLCLQQYKGNFKLNVSWIYHNILMKPDSPYTSWLIDDTSFAIVRMAMIKFPQKRDPIEIPILNFLYSDNAVNVLNRLFMMYAEYPFMFIIQSGNITDEVVAEVKGLITTSDTHINYYNLPMNYKKEDLYLIYY